MVLVGELFICPYCFLRRLAEGLDAGYVSAGRLHKRSCMLVLCRWDTEGIGGMHCEKSEKSHLSQKRGSPLNKQ